MQIYRYPEKSKWAEIVARPAIEIRDLESLVAPVLENVRRNGDAALR